MGTLSSALFPPFLSTFLHIIFELLAELEFEPTPKLDEDKFVNFEETKELEMTDPGCLRLFNIILNKSFRSMNLFPVKSPSKERSYFNPNAKHSLVKHKLEVWPGYITRWILIKERSLMTSHIRVGSSDELEPEFSSSSKPEPWRCRAELGHFNFRAETELNMYIIK